MNLKFNQIINQPYKGDYIISATVDTDLGTVDQNYIRFKNKWYEYPSFTPASATHVVILESEFQKHPKTKVKVGKPIKKKKPKSAPAVKLEIDSKPILFVVATPNENAEDTDVFQSISRISKIYKTNYNGAVKNPEVEIVTNNSDGLSVVYNRYLTEKYKNHIIVFLHDDAIVDDLLIIDKLNVAHKQFGIVGVAGAKKTVVKSPAMWHLMSKKEDLRGFCAHKKQDGGVYTTPFGESNSEVDVIDGVFISVDVDEALRTNTRFDEDFDFHFYDLAFCLGRGKGMKVGVWPIFIRHFGMGTPDSRWKELEETFIKKYG